MKTNTVILTLFLFVVFISCHQNKKRWDKDVSDINIDRIEIHDYGKALFEINPDSLKEGLKAISGQFPFFLNADLDDTLNLIQIHDYITDHKLIDLYNAVCEKYTNLNSLEDELTEAFRHYKYYYTEDTIPRVYAYISGLQYESPILYFDSVLIIGMDLYLGEQFKPYKKIGLPLYLTRRMKSKYIVPDCMKAIAISKIKDQQQNPTLLNEMVKRGKILYFVDAMLPEIPDSVKIGYSPNKLEWCKKNEADIWVFLINNELLYSRDHQDIVKFLSESPFTSGFGHDSPGRIGEWIGWQIVRKFMQKNTGCSLQELLKRKDSQEILKDSKYKPKS